MNSIELSHVTYSYEHENRGLSDVSFAVPEGSFTVLIGRSGSGKSTLLKLAGGLVSPQSGKAERSGPATFVFQSGALLPWKTVGENAALGAIGLGLSEAETKSRVEKALGEVLIPDLRDKYPRDISGGERQRVGIARALVSDPDILLLDEPFSALDEDTAQRLRATLLDVWHSHKMTILMVSHLIDEAVYLADRIAVMKEGKVVSAENVTLPRPRDMSAPNLRALSAGIEKKL